MNDNTINRTLQAAVARTGWDLDAQLELLLQYIGRQDSPEAFQDFIDQAAEEPVSPPPPEDAAQLSEDAVNELIEVIWPRLDSGRWEKADAMDAVYNVLDAWEPRE